MAKPGRLYLPLDLSYFDDARVVELSDAAQLLDIRAMLLARRLQSDGRLTRTQIARIAPGIASDIEAIILEWLKVGLWAEEGDTLTRHGWDGWNASAEEIASKQAAGALGNHQRWHQNRGIVDPDCRYCESGAIAPATDGESGANRIANPRQDQTRPDEDTDQTRPGATFSVESNRKVQAVLLAIVDLRFKAGHHNGNAERFRRGIENNVRAECAGRVRELVETTDLSIPQLVDKIEGTQKTDRRAGSYGRLQTAGAIG